MPDPHTTADETIRGFLARLGKPTDFDASTSLYGDGLGLDSLEVAELSVLLEDTFGNDPFSAGLEVTTIGQVSDFYAATA
jgi:acyl carrier protein